MESVGRQHLIRLYTWLVVAVGAFVCLLALRRLPIPHLDSSFLILATLTTVSLAIVVVKFPQFKYAVPASNVFTYLVFLRFDGEAAILLGAMGGLFLSARFTKEPLNIAFRTASTACAICATVWALRLFFAPGPYYGESIAGAALAIGVIAVVQYLIHFGLDAVAELLEEGWEDVALHDWPKESAQAFFGYLVCATLAVTGAAVMGDLGFYAVIVIAPLITVVAVVCSGYLSYHEHIKASAAQAERAERYLTELQESEERYRTSFERFRSAFDHAPIGMALVAPYGGWLQVNQSLCDLVGYSEQEMLGMDFQSITHQKDLYTFVYKANQVLTGKLQTHQGEMRFIHKQGRQVWVLVNISIDCDPQSRAQHLIFQIQDITDRKRAEEQLLHDAFHDALTGLPNRAWFMEQLQAALDQMKAEEEKPFAVLFLDLDRFKVINDSLGHMIGDQLLIGIAQRLRNCLRAEDIVARLGGDEFTILLKDGSEATLVAQRVQKNVAQPFNLGSYEAFTTASIGIAFASPDYSRPEDLLRDADTAMYQAKALGKARHALFDKSMHARAMNMLQLETDLRRAIERNEFFVEYQPIMSLLNARLTGFEALVRWQHPELGLIAPDKFIGMAEEAGFIIPIGHWVLHEACRQMRRWQVVFSENLPLTMSVNLSGKQFGHANLVEQVMKCLEINGLAPHMLRLEITESAVMESFENAAKVLEQLRGFGIGLSIDDFGTGYSSLNYLHRLPIDTLKIDRSFVSNLGKDKENKEIVRTIIMLAQNLGMGVVAEGVETETQLERLKELKCHSGQGYLFGRPMGAAAAEEFIRKMRQGQADVGNVEESYRAASYVGTYTM